MEKSAIDWKKEKDNLFEGKGLEWFKPRTGQQTIKFLSNGEKYITNFEDKDIEKVRFEIEVEGQQLNWGVVRGKTQNSLYGQIALIGSSRGTLVNNQITLLVKGSGKEKNYTIIEALPLMTIQ